MTTKKKAARAGTRTASNTAFDNRNPTPTASRVKALIVRLAVWGLLPAGLAGWIIRRFHLEAA